MRTATAPDRVRRARSGCPRLAAVLTLPLVAALAGCSSSSHPLGAVTTAPTTSPTPVATTPATTPASTTPPSASATATPAPTRGPTTAGAAACPTRALGTRNGGSQGTAGSTYATIDFTNNSGVTCTLHGFPGVSLAGGTPVHQIGAPATHNPSQGVPVVTLTPGQVSHFVLQISHATNYPPSECQPVVATYLQIYPPNQTTPVYLSYSSTACAKPVHILTVSAVQAGPA